MKIFGIVLKLSYALGFNLGKRTYNFFLKEHFKIYLFTYLSIYLSIYLFNFEGDID